MSEYALMRCQWLNFKENSYMNSKTIVCITINQNDNVTKQTLTWHQIQ